MVVVVVVSFNIPINTLIGHSRDGLHLMWKTNLHVTYQDTNQNTTQKSHTTKVQMTQLLIYAVVACYKMSSTALDSHKWQFQRKAGNETM